MNSAASEPALIGLDWGTSSFRASLIGADGGVIVAAVTTTWASFRVNYDFPVASDPEVNDR